MHIPGYQFCGPDTKFAKQDNSEARNTADRVSAEIAWNRILARDAKIGEVSC